MNKILLLGGSAQQIVAIETAKRLGYYTVLCDYLSDNPGQYHADKFYLVSTTEKEAVLKVAQVEKVDGVLAYASDPAAPTAAFIAEKLGLPSNPFDSVEILCNKDRFRHFLRENGFRAPMAVGCANMDISQLDREAFQLPVIVKPVDSSGSKGVTVLYSWANLIEAVKFANDFSRTNRVIIEEYIEKKHEYLIGGDIFIYNGKIVLWGLLNCHRDANVNALVPVGKSYPLRLGDDLENVKNTLSRIVTTLGLQFGSVNVELIVDKNGAVWPIDIGPRAGGNMIPDLLSEIWNLDVVELSVKVAMGDPICTEHFTNPGFYATHNLHCSKDGILQGIVFSENLERFIIKKCIYVKPGNNVYYFDNASRALGIIFMKFPDAETQKNILDHINDYIDIQVN